METPKAVKTYGKTIAWIAGIGVVSYIAYRIYKNNKAANDLAKTKNDLKTLSETGIQPSYLSSQYTVFANNIKQAAYGVFTDEKAIYSVFDKMKNDADVLKVYDAFGIWKYPCNAVEFPLSTLFGRSDCGSGDLAMLLTDKLDSSEIKEINNILSKKGIKYRF
jgi:hypothetical protein